MCNVPGCGALRQQERFFGGRVGRRAGGGCCSRQYSRMFVSQASRAKQQCLRGMSLQSCCPNTLRHLTTWRTCWHIVQNLLAMCSRSFAVGCGTMHTIDVTLCSTSSKVAQCSPAFPTWVLQGPASPGGSCCPLQQPGQQLRHQLLQQAHQLPTCPS